METSYDQVLYQGFPYAQSHPDRLATMATLFGLNPAPVDRCRVLELGCGDGANLLPMAFTFPNSTFAGIDLAETPIAAGQKAVAELGLTNVQLKAADILKPGMDGKFDYVIAHGVYSWVPEPVRDRLMALTREVLTPDGIAYISYNAMPGCHIRQMIREMMLFHLRNVEDPDARIEQALALLQTLMEAPESGENATPALVKEEIKALFERNPAVLFHDELGDVYHPVSFSDFMAHAGRHRLQYLSEANGFDMEPNRFSPAVRKQVENYAGGSRIAREQYMDFLKCRKFRQTLLCSSELTVAEEPIAERVKSLYAASQASADSPSPDLTGDTIVEFRGPRGAAAKTAHPLPKLALGYLSSVWPETKHFDEILDWCCNRAGSQHDADGLAQILIAMFKAGLVDLHSCRLACVSAPGPKPKTTEFARWQVRAGKTVTTLRHTTIEATGGLETTLLTLLDGTRDRAALAAELDHDSLTLMEDLEANLQKLARFGLLIQ